MQNTYALLPYHHRIMYLASNIPPCSFNKQHLRNLWFYRAFFILSAYWKSATAIYARIFDCNICLAMFNSTLSIQGL